MTKAWLLILCVPLALRAQPVDTSRIEKMLPEGMALPEPPATQPGVAVPIEGALEAAQALAPAMNLGFEALGPTGAKGAIDGPGSRGNGTYEVVKNEPYEVNLVVKTGYMECRIVLSRDPVTGKDSVRIAGKKWDSDKSQWGPDKDATMPAEIRYDPSKDRGIIRYQKKDKWIEEAFWGHEDGDRMTIEFSGGWNHEFKPAAPPAAPAPEQDAKP